MRRYGFECQQLKEKEDETPLDQSIIFLPDPPTYRQEVTPSEHVDFDTTLAVVAAALVMV